MAEQNQELDSDSQNESEESEELSAEELQEKLQEAEQEKKQLYARTKKAEEKMKELKDVVSSSEEDEEDDSAENADTELDEQSVEKRIEARIGLKQEGFSDEEVETIENFAKANSMSLQDAKSHPIIQGGIESLRKQKRSEEATPPSSNRTTQTPGEKSFKDMSDEERAAFTKELIEKQKRGK